MDTRLVRSRYFYAAKWYLGRESRRAKARGKERRYISLCASFERTIKRLGTSVDEYKRNRRSSNQTTRFVHIQTVINIQIFDEASSLHWPAHAHVKLISFFLFFFSGIMTSVLIIWTVIRHIVWKFWNPIHHGTKPIDIQLDHANLNSVISNSPLFRTKSHFPWTCPSVIYYRLFRTPDISNYFSLPLRVRNSEVQLY